MLLYATIFLFLLFQEVVSIIQGVESININHFPGLTFCLPYGAVSVEVDKKVNKTLQLMYSLYRKFKKHMHIKLSLQLYMIEHQMYNSDHRQIQDFLSRFIRVWRFFINVNVPINLVVHLTKGLVIKPYSFRIIRDLPQTE